VARPPLPEKVLVERFGPHPSYVPPGGWSEQAPPDRLVKTHCCFCGQQCGIQLKVRDNQVVGFEPWEEFPFNRGMLCPKGVKRYLQNEHPDRLKAPLLRTEAGFQATSWDEALDFTARRLREVQERYGKDAVAIYGGASLTTEKSYLLGKFARVALGTRHIDYNGRLCMVSAGTAYKMALGVDRCPNPWSDIPKAQVVLVTGANVAECAPITTDYLWRMRDAGGKLIVIDPRMTPITRNADLYLPVRPGTDVALLMGMLHAVLRDGLEDREFIAEHTAGFEEVAASVKPWDPRRTAELTGVRPDAIEKAARWFAEADRAIALHARGIEHQSKGVENVLSVINLCLALGHIGREGAGCMMITGQGNGQGGREHGQKCDQLPGQRSINDPAAREHVARVWGIRPEEIPGPGLTAMEIMEAIHRGEIKALLSICFNPIVSLPDAGYIAEALEKLEFFGVVDFFLSETAYYADVVLAGSLQEEEEGIVCTAEGVSSTSRRRSRLRRGPGTTGRSTATWHAGWAKSGSFPTGRRGRSSTSSAKRRGEASPITTGSRTRSSTASSASSGRAPRRTTRARRASSREACSLIPTGGRASSWRSTGRAATRWTRSFRPTSRRGASYPSTSRARRPAASEPWWTSTPSRASRSTRGSPTRSASPPTTGLRSRRGGAR
jgi:assimilatory nitrate reductase catalytic subunit